MAPRWALVSEWGTSMDQLRNLKLLGWITMSVRLGEYCETARDLQLTVPHNYPVFGRDAFRTATGVHAAAVIKATKKGISIWQILSIREFLQEVWLRTGYEIGPMSGKCDLLARETRY
jgi:2-isopropylmalate synthase